MLEKKKKFFPWLFIIVGLVLVYVIPLLAYEEIKKNSDDNAASSEEIAATILQENLKKESVYDFSVINPINNTDVGSRYDDQDLVSGRLIIPRVDINLTLYNGITNKILRAGVGTMKPESVMGEGNFAIAGHSSKRRSLLLGRLSDVQIGDKVLLTDNEHTYEYIVYDKRVVKSTETQLIKDELAEEHGVPIVSVMNCYEKDDNYRNFVFGELINIELNKE